jgi:phosphoribosylaminoimidazolecarboxamide formyltransferase/IMP cyclohydrolase
VNSPYGGIVAFNREVQQDVAQELSKFFLEVIIAPSYSPEAFKVFNERKNLRLLELKGL